MGGSKTGQPRVMYRRTQPVCPGEGGCEERTQPLSVRNAGPMMWASYTSLRGLTQPGWMEKTANHMQNYVSGFLCFTHFVTPECVAHGTTPRPMEVSALLAMLAHRNT